MAAVCIDMDKHGQPDAFRFRRTDYGNEQALTFGKRLGHVEASDMIPGMNSVKVYVDHVQVCQRDFDAFLHAFYFATYRTCRQICRRPLQRPFEKRGGVTLDKSPLMGCCAEIDQALPASETSATASSRSKSFIVVKGALVTNGAEHRVSR